jgi:beta-lactamase regulating signal transducer with metallopeptidase domain/Tol biopolymer transport system component
VILNPYILFERAVSIVSLLPAIAAEILIQSMLLLAAGLSISYGLKRWGAVVQTLFHRVTLVAVLVTPILSIALRVTGVQGLVVAVPIPALTVLNMDNRGGIDAHAQGGMGTETRGRHTRAPSQEPYGEYAQFGHDSYQDHPPVSSVQNGNEFHSSTIIPPQPVSSSPNSEAYTSAGTIIPGVERALTASDSRGHIGRVACAVLIYAGLALWMGFSVFLAIRLIIGNIYVKRLRSRAVDAPDHVRDLCALVAQELHVSCTEVLESEDVVSPLTAGFFRPFILLPAHDIFNEARMREVFLHELTHIKRSDFLWSQLRNLGTVVLPFHPLMWILSFWMEVYSDFICDDYVIAYKGDRQLYAKNLVVYSSRSFSRVEQFRVGMGIISFSSPLRSRIIRILDTNRIIPLGNCRALIFSVTFLFACASLATGFINITNHTSFLSTTSRSINLVDDGAGIDAENRSADVPKSIPDMPGTGSDFPPKSLQDIPVSAVQSDIDNAREHVQRKTLVVSDDEQVHVIAKSEDTVQLFGMEQPAILTDALQKGTTDVATVYPDHDTSEIEEVSAFGESSAHMETVGDGISEFSPKTADADLPDPEAVATGEPGQPAESSPLASIWSSGVPVPVYQSSGRMEITAAKTVNTVNEVRINTTTSLGISGKSGQSTLYNSLVMSRNEPTWSPDGSLIAFTDNNRIWTIPATGGSPTLVYENFHDDTDIPVGCIQSLSFSPDGHEVMFQKNAYNMSQQGFIKFDGEYIVTFSDPIINVESVNIETGEHRIVFRSAYGCVWSRNGRYLAFLSRNTSLYCSLMIYDSQKKEISILALGKDIHFGTPAFTPDNSAIIIPVRTENNAIQLFRYPISGGDPEVISGSGGVGQYLNYPDCSPDGRWILYTDYTYTEENRNIRLMLRSTITGEVFPIGDDDGMNASFGKWSPDGSRICYIAEGDDSRYLCQLDFSPGAYPLSKPVMEDAAPMGFAVRGNFPNPFNPSTTIEYSLPKEELVEVTIYNIMGQTVRRLVNERKPEGMHTAVWDSRDDNGMTCASGVYIARLFSAGTAITHKMTLQK